VVGRETVRAWHPDVPGVAEVFHAHFTGHVYPMHTHDTWTLLIVDDGAIRYDLHRHEHGAVNQMVTLLPPHVPHNGRSATSEGFHKRVVYLESTQLPDDLIGAAADFPVLRDPLLWHRIHQLHASMDQSGEELEAESRLVLVAERLRWHVRGRSATSTARPRPTLARQLRDVLDASVRERLTLREIGATLHADPVHLVRSFNQEFGITPHRYLIGRRVDLARRLLLQGMPPGDVAATAGFYDQAHLGRHFKATLGTSPGKFARSGLAPVNGGRKASQEGTAPAGYRSATARSPRSGRTHPAAR
jgi:AraC-like DNA-binding protein